MNFGMGHHSRLEVMAFYQGAVALMGFFYSLNVPVQARRRVSADVAWNRRLGAL
jgi:hypothetical protein